MDVGISEYGGRESLTVLCEAEEDDQIEAARLNPSSHKLSPGSSRIDLACLRQIMLDIGKLFHLFNMIVCDFFAINEACLRGSHTCIAKHFNMIMMMENILLIMVDKCMLKLKWSKVKWYLTWELLGRL